MAEYVGLHWCQLQSDSSTLKDFIVSSPLSSTPLPIYRWVISNFTKFGSWDRFKFLLMDEQIEDGPDLSYVKLTDAASYEAFARNNFLNSLSELVRRPVEEMLVKPSLYNLAAMNDEIIDLLILAFGEDGHYAQAMPGTDISVGFHVAELSALLTTMHTASSSLSFPKAHFRKTGMSIGPQQVLGAKQVFVIASGNAKAKAVSQLLKLTEFHKEFPISIVKHPLVRERVHLCFTEDTVAN